MRKNVSITSDPPVKSSEMQLMKCSNLTVAELKLAEREILRRVQQVAFQEVLVVLSAAECSEDKSYSKRVLRKAGTPINQLNSQLKERVGERVEVDRLISRLFVATQSPEIPFFVLQRTEKKSAKIYNARAQPVLCSLNL